MKKHSKLLWESLDHYWTTMPYVFRNVTINEGVNTNTVINKELSFLYVLEGSFKITLSHKPITINKNDLVCINTYVPHSQETTKGIRYVRIMMDSNYLMYNGLNPSTVFFEEHIRDPKIDELFADMVREHNENHRSNIILNSLVLYLIGYLTKNYSQKKEPSKEEIEHTGLTNYGHIGPALNYISLNFTSEIPLDTLCTISNLSKSYFLKLFKELVGTTPMDYINSVRCNFAKQLILKGASITEASISSGFNSTSYFTLCFKKHIGCLPSELLKNQ